MPISIASSSASGWTRRPRVPCAGSGHTPTPCWHSGITIHVRLHEWIPRRQDQVGIQDAGQDPARVTGINIEVVIGLPAKNDAGNNFVVICTDTTGDPLVRHVAGFYVNCELVSKGNGRGGKDASRLRRLARVGGSDTNSGPKQPMASGKKHATTTSPPTPDRAISCSL